MAILVAVKGLGLFVCECKECGCPFVILKVWLLLCHCNHWACSFVSVRSVAVLVLVKVGHFFATDRSVDVVVSV